MGLVRSSRGVDVDTNQRYYLVYIRECALWVQHDLPYINAVHVSEWQKIIAIGEMELEEASEYDKWESERELNSMSHRTTSVFRTFSSMIQHPHVRSRRQPIARR